MKERIWSYLTADWENAKLLHKREFFKYVTRFHVGRNISALKCYGM